MRALISGGLAAALLLVATSAAAQDQNQAGGMISRQQAEQLVATLTQRNQQLRDMSARLRELEGRAAAADAMTRELEASRKALAIGARKNRELAEIAEAVITDYEKMDLGKRTAAKEPLTQLYRVRLQNKMQEFRDQVAAEGFYPERELDQIKTQAAAPAAPATNP
jgi:2'-5' RNA ligase